SDTTREGASSIPPLIYTLMPWRHNGSLLSFRIRATVSRHSNHIVPCGPARAAMRPSLSFVAHVSCERGKCSLIERQRAISHLEVRRTRWRGALTQDFTACRQQSLPDETFNQ